MDDRDRLDELEARIAAIEQRLGASQEPLQHRQPTPQAREALQELKARMEQERSVAEEWTPAPLRAGETRETAWARPETADTGGFLRAANILGWGGATAFVLAAAYLIRLAVESGWLTPQRQIFGAVLLALAMIGAGIRLRASSPRYASLLPAGGVVILFLCAYGAHLFYGLIGLGGAGAAVVAVSLVSLWLCWLFRNQMFALFATLGSYSAPFLIGAGSERILDLVFYYMAWNVLFCVYAIAVRSRAIYLLAAYMSLIGFDVVFHLEPSADWRAALEYQFVQLAIFMTCTGYFSLRHRLPLTREEAYLHAPPLLLFYALQYALLDRHLPAYAPWISLASLGALAGIYFAAKSVLRNPLPGGRWLLGAYAALVLFHAGYVESVPDRWAPWLGLLAAALTPWLARRISASRDGAWWPLTVAVLIVFLSNYARVLFNLGLDEVWAGGVLFVLYPLLVYLGYFLARREQVPASYDALLLYAGHAGAMAAPAQLFDNAFQISAAWGTLGVACIILALRTNDRKLGQSSLVIFGLFALKVLLYDVSDAGPLVRIGSLLALAVSLYLGGWLFRKVSDLGGDGDRGPPADS